MDFLTIGHACHDTKPSGFLPGGAVTYSGVFAKKLNLETAVLTSVGRDYQFRDLFKDITFKSVTAEHTTVFQNTYNENQRQQYLLNRALDIKPVHLPANWNNPKMVFISPIANEVHFDFLNHFQNALVCINPQGWMRRWDESGKVFHEVLKDYQLLAKADITIISEEDVNFDQQIIQDMAVFIDILVVTKGEEGCDLYFNQQKTSIPAFKTKVIDATGAGDTFSTAFLVYYQETGDLITAAQYGNVSASFCIESNDIGGLPDRSQIEERYKKYINLI